MRHPKIQYNADRCRILQKTRKSEQCKRCLIEIFVSKRGMKTEVYVLIIYDEVTRNKKRRQIVHARFMPIKINLIHNTHKKRNTKPMSTKIENKLTLIVSVTLFWFHKILLFSCWTDLNAIIKYRFTNFAHVGLLLGYCTW